MQTAYTGETQRLSLPVDAACLLAHLLNHNPNQRFEITTLTHSIKAQTRLLQAAHDYICQARLLLDELSRFHSAAQQYPGADLPPQIAAILREVQL
jgi:hypothetical protein